MNRRLITKLVPWAAPAVGALTLGVGIATAAVWLYSNSTPSTANESTKNEVSSPSSPIILNYRKYASERTGSLPRIAITTNNILLKPKGSAYELIPEAVEVLKWLCGLSDVYLITDVQTDEQENNATRLLQASGIFTSGMNPCKLLFSEKLDGRIAMIRQIKPILHIDPSEYVINKLRQFFEGLALITPEAKLKKGIFTAASLSQLFPEHQQGARM